MMGFSIFFLIPLIAIVLPTLNAFPMIPVPPKAMDRGDNKIYQAIFQQKISGDNPALGTFSQRYWYSTEFWKGSGSPVIFFTPGEVDGDNYVGYLTNWTLPGQYAKAVGGAVVMLEHRYYGGSSPYDTLTTTNLQYLTLKDAISDVINFARTVKLPFDDTGKSNAPNAPWIFVGGSYSGALVAWTEEAQPGTFWAYHATSAPVEAISDYWQYFAPVQQGMPKNCSKDVSLVIDFVDELLTNGSPSDKSTLKTAFGLGGIEHDDDFAAAIETGPWLWQANTFTTGYSGFFQFCDAVEGVTAGQAKIPDANGVGTEKALVGYASWFKTSMLPGYCKQYGWSGDQDIGCFDTYDKNNKMFTNLTVRNPANRQWNWLLCNEPFAYWQDGAPKGTPSIVSRLVNANYWQRQCALFFPDEGRNTFGSSPSHHPVLNVDSVNSQTQGWLLPENKPATRLMWTNGEFDPWKTSSVSSPFRPGGDFKGTDNMPVHIVPGGFHCSDFSMHDALVNSEVMKVVDAEIAQIKTWVDEFYAQKQGSR